MQLEVYDFHTHSLLSDGVLSPLELVRRACVKGYKAIAITDHAGPASLEHLIPRLIEECRLAQEYWGVLALPGVELTHLPPAAIPQAAKRAKELGAQIVVVHGESLVEPVEKGTNKAAISCPDVDILAHPGLISSEEAELAAKNGIFLEITARRGHCLFNGYVARMVREKKAPFLLGSDAHRPEELFTPELFQNIFLGAGLKSYSLLKQYIQKLLNRLPLSFNRSAV